MAAAPGPMSIEDSDVIVVGSGIAGLCCALSLAPRSVRLITKTSELAGGSSYWAQGGIAAAVGHGDSPQSHAADTLDAGAGLSDPASARELTEEGAASLDWLLEQGVPFDRTADGSLALAREAAHRHARVVHAGGDTTGQLMMQSLIRNAQAAGSIALHDATFVADLVVDANRVCGLLAHDAARGWVFYRAPSVVLATGGIGMSWWRTTNPLEATGDGLAMAARAGAELADLEFVQFHPTALAAERQRGGASLPLLTEALRGAGAVLLDAAGNRFMPDEHALAELAPRDVVARAIHRRNLAGQTVYLDLRPVLAGSRAADFPRAVAIAEAHGLDAWAEPLPVTTAAHYHMGGIRVDRAGRTSVRGLWACGEVATTGVHGANRLASNSLLEAIVYARRIAVDIAGRALSRQFADAEVVPPLLAKASFAEAADALSRKARKTMSRQVGILRNGKGLVAAAAELDRMSSEFQDAAPDASPADASAAWVRRHGEIRNQLLVARLITLAALRREESRGAHFRRDFPLPRPEWRRAQSLRLDQLVESH